MPDTPAQPEPPPPALGSMPVASPSWPSSRCSGGEWMGELDFLLWASPFPPLEELRGDTRPVYGRESAHAFPQRGNGLTGLTCLAHRRPQLLHRSLWPL